MKKGFKRYECTKDLKKVQNILLDSNMTFPEYCFVMDFLIQIIQCNIDLDSYITRKEKEKVYIND